MALIELEEKNYDCAEVVAKLKEQVTPERWQKITAIIEKRNKNTVTVMENIYNRGNTSAVMRSAEAFGFHLFHQIVTQQEFKESKRVTQGADKWLIQHNWSNTLNCIQGLKNQGYKILVTHLEGGTPIEQISFSEPVALCFGNEKEGASPELTQLADQKIYIPMAGFVQSFNISVAAALCFQYVSLKQNQLDLPQLSDEERQYLRALYLYRSLKNPKL